MHGDCVDLLNQFDFKFDMIFADPPYFLSNDGISVQSGKMVSVNKGDWDKSQGFEKDNEFNYNWLKACQNHLTDNGSIWISGTFHNIFSVAQMLTELGFKILNCITWAKTNPPPNLSCRYFTHSTEFILWARKSKKSSHYYNYDLMKQINGGTQMRDVWNLPAIAPWEKSCGKHPTQKPLELIKSLIEKHSNEGDLVLDTFAGTFTVHHACDNLNRGCISIEKEEKYFNIGKERINTNRIKLGRKTL